MKEAQELIFPAMLTPGCAGPDANNADRAPKPLSIWNALKTTAPLPYQTSNGSLRTYLAGCIFMLYVIKSVVFESVRSHGRSLIIPSSAFSQTPVACNDGIPVTLSTAF